MTADGAFDPQRLLRVLSTHEVRFVLIGGWAAVLHGSPTVTVDLDICYGRSPANLERLASALTELEVRLRGFPPDLPFAIDARALRSRDVFTLTTSAGDLDLLGAPAGVGGYDDLLRGAIELVLDDITLRVASIDDLIRMKTAAGRPKDLIEIPILQALREETRHDVDG
jgi:hypothetical protein